jgi:hypothetical protein
MPSVIGLLEERERDAGHRVEALRQEADRVLAELRDAERCWERFVTAREAVVEVLAGSDRPADADEVAVPVIENAAPMPAVSVGGGAVPGSQVPTWRAGRAVSVLSPEYQRVVAVLAAADGSLVCKDIAAGLGLERVPAKVEGVRSKANRLVQRGWLVKEPSGAFTLAQGVRAAGS